jgi:serine/threonine-protein kinase RsbW
VKLARTIIVLQLSWLTLPRASAKLIIYFVWVKLGVKMERKLLHLSFSSSFDFMDTAHELVEQVLQLANFKEEDIYWLTIAAREAIANAIKHGNKLDETKKVEVDLSLVDETFIMTVKDEGQGFNLQNLPDPRAPENLLANSGRGVYYMRTFMDSVDFEILPGEGTLVTMTKNKNSSLKL